MKELSRTTVMDLACAPAHPGARAPTTTPPETLRKSRRVVVMPASAFGYGLLGELPDSSPHVRGVSSRAGSGPGSVASGGRASIPYARTGWRRWGRHEPHAAAGDDHRGSGPEEGA